MSTDYTLRYVGNVPRSRPEMNWVVQTTYYGSMSFWYFVSLQEAVACYPSVRDQALAFHLEHAQRELNDFASPGCDDPYTIRLLNSRLTACRNLLEQPL